MAIIGIERTRVDDSVRTLARYNVDPFIMDFLRKQPEPPKPPKQKKGTKRSKRDVVKKIPINRYDKAEVCDIIRLVLLGEYTARSYAPLRLDALVAHLDELQETGRQHVYLFQLPEAKLVDHLPRLRDLSEVKKLCGGDNAIYGDGVLEWEARKGPLLVRIWNDARSLLFKWIETREYWIPEPTEGSESEDLENEEEFEEDEEREPAGVAQPDKKVRTMVRREERATSFCVIDLENGNCELRIQAIRGQSKETRLQQLSTYRALTEKLLGFELVGPTVLAPAIRRALIARENVEIVYCSAILPEGGRFTGGKGELPPVDLRKLEAGVKITFTYRQPSGSVARIELDGRLDEIFISRAMIPDQHRLLLERVQRWREERLDGVAQRPETKRRAPTIKIAVDSRIQPEPTNVDPQIDEAIREYSQTHDLTPDVVSTSDPRALEQFLRYIAEVARREHARYERELKALRAEERWTQRLHVMASLIALAIFTTGAALVLFAPAKLATGTITTLLTALTGRGTWLIRSYAKSVKAKRERLEDQQRDSRDTLIGIQMALVIPDPDLRSRAMAEVTLMLLRRLTGVTPPPSPPFSAPPRA